MNDKYFSDIDDEFRIISAMCRGDFLVVNKKNKIDSRFSSNWWRTVEPYRKEKVWANLINEIDDLYSNKYDHFLKNLDSQMHSYDKIVNFGLSVNRAHEGLIKLKYTYYDFFQETIDHEYDEFFVNILKKSKKVSKEIEQTRLKALEHDMLINGLEIISV